MGSIATRHDVEKDVVLDAQAIVVGTGAGGGVVAAELAEAGLDVLVLEEGSHHPTEEFVPSAVAMTPRLYRDGGASVALGTPPIFFAEGRCVGGSTVVNGGMSWRTPEKILARWRRDDGVDGLEAHFERVERRISAQTQDAESIGRDNLLLKKGADAKGWEVIPNVRNQVHCAGSNNCIFGCPTKAKRSTLVSYIPRALAFGARVQADCRVERLDTRGKRIVGVSGHIVRENGTRGPRVVARAPVVVVCAGAIQTPTLLLRSGIRSPSGQIGMNLALHPNAKVVAIFDEDVHGWQGVHQAYQVRQFQDEGFIMAAVTVPPAVLAMTLPAYGEELGEIMRAQNRIVTGGILVEDTVSGQVRALPGGNPLVTYPLSDTDAARILRGSALLAELLFAAGAKKVIMPFTGMSMLGSVDEVRALAHKKIPRRALDLMTVHMMGTARMGNDRARHVCDPSGKVYDTEGLWVADASLFPSPIGVNPMETIMALATRVSERLVARRAA